MSLAISSLESAEPRERFHRHEVVAILRDLQSAVRHHASRHVASDRQATFATTFTTLVLASYWRAAQQEWGLSLPLAAPPGDVPQQSLTPGEMDLASTIGASAARLGPIEAGYHIGEIYTTLVPPQQRAARGIYYTPPALSSRLLDLATAAGIDWVSCRVVDISCGGGAFLTPVALRMASVWPADNPQGLLISISQRLHGFDIDALGAWISHVCCEVALLPFYRATGQRLEQLVTVCDSLLLAPEENGVDLVIGNPPYGRTTLSDEQRHRFARSLYGHANLYGVFTDLAIRWTRPSGLIAYVTPTSFLSGTYFKALRRLLADTAPPIAIDLVTDRKGVFADVLQETLLAVYRRDGHSRRASVHVITATNETTVTALPTGSLLLPPDVEEPWLLPRNSTQEVLISRMRLMPHRLADYGYTVSTGPLVWNRHKTQLMDKSAPGTYPLIWAESITTDGQFAFRAEKKNHAPFFLPYPGDEWLITSTECVLVQRTTAKEQRRRLIAAVLPSEFIATYGAVVIENHVNMVLPTREAPAVALSVLLAVLNSDIVDEAFRCMSGSVAVSAFELEALPLPAPQHLHIIAAMIAEGAAHDRVNSALTSLYLGAIAA